MARIHMDSATEIGQLNLIKPGWSLAIIHENIARLDIYDQPNQIQLIN